LRERSIFKIERDSLLASLVVATLLTASALGLRVLLGNLLDRSTFMPFFLAVVFSAWYGGLWPGILSTLLSAVIGAVYLIPAQSRVPTPASHDFTQLFLFMLSAVAIAYVAGNLKSTSARLREEKLKLTAEIARREAADHSASATESRFRLAIEAGKMGIWEWDSEQNVVTWSPAMEELFGLDPGTFEGSYEGYLDRIHPADRDEAKNAVMGALAEGGSDFERRFRTIRPDGTLRWIASRGKGKFDNGRLVGLHGICYDVTSDVFAEEASARLAVIVKTSDDGIVSKDLNGTILSWNQGAERIFGYQADEIVGKSIDILLPDDRKEEEQVILGKLRAGESLDHFESVRVRKDGREIFVSATISPIRDSSGKIIGASKIVRDITERKQAEARLADEDRRKDVFLATLAHELRNPLAPLQSAVGVLRVAQSDPSVLDNVIPVMQRQLDQLVRLVDDLLDVSRITSGKLNLRLDWNDISSVISTAVEAILPAMKAKSQDLQVDISEGGFHIYADGARISQVVANILHNASKFSPPNSNIHLQVNRDMAGALIQVRDEGIGLTADQIPYIFDSFSQVESSLKHSNGGLGIGLSLVQGLVEKHGGKVTATSAGIGKGTEFRIFLPIPEREQLAELRTEDWTR
jgi:PAS domain S-box-containing protein